jgi:hypothetical protein
MVKAPISAPPNAAAVGMYMRSTSIMRSSRQPFMIICWSCSCLATSSGAEPETVIHVREKSAHEPMTKAM